MSFNPSAPESRAGASIRAQQASKRLGLFVTAWTQGCEREFCTSTRSGKFRVRMRLAPLSNPMDNAIIEYINTVELESAFTADLKILAIDVRSAEERGDGHLRKSVHIPYDDWVSMSDSASAMLNRAVAEDKMLVFHCMYSRERAPACAKIAAAAQPQLQVAVLRGGFQQLMVDMFKDERLRTLFENLKPERWVDGGRQGPVWAPDAAANNTVFQPSRRLPTRRPAAAAPTAAAAPVAAAALDLDAAFPNLSEHILHRGGRA